MRIAIVVEYDLEQEIMDLHASGFPAPDWLAEILRPGKFILPG